MANKNWWISSGDEERSSSSMLLKQLQITRQLNRILLNGSKKALVHLGTHFAAVRLSDEIIANNVKKNVHSSEVTATIWFCNWFYLEPKLMFFTILLKTVFVKSCVTTENTAMEFYMIGFEIQLYFFYYRVSVY